MSAASDEASSVIVRSEFLPKRNALALRVSMGPLYMDYYLHLMQHGIRLDPAQDLLLKDALAAIALHVVSRPRDESTAWTVNYREPILNLFVTGDSRTGLVTGRIFTEGVRISESNLFNSQVVRGTSPARQSMVAVQDTDFLVAACQFYRQSQQLPAQFFRLSDLEDFALISAMPGCDLAWLEALTPEAVEKVAESEELHLLETRQLSFGCQCTLARIVRTLTALGHADREALFEDNDALEITCPRCAAKYFATREQIRDALE